MIQVEDDNESSSTPWLALVWMSFYDAPEKYANIEIVNFGGTSENAVGRQQNG
jgi:hypothetical protein